MSEQEKQDPVALARRALNPAEHEWYKDPESGLSWCRRCELDYAAWNGDPCEDVPTREDLARAVLDLHKELVWQRDQTNTQARAECEMRKQRDAARAEVEHLKGKLDDIACRAATGAGGRYVYGSSMKNTPIHYSKKVTSEFAPCGARIMRSLGDDAVIFPCRADPEKVTCHICRRAALGGEGTDGE